MLGLRHMWTLELSSVTVRGGASRAPEDPRPGGDISWGAINNRPPLPVIFPELCGEGDCEALCWNLAARRLGEQPHAGSYSAGQFSSSFGSFTQPCTQWLHKADYKLQRIPEGAKSDAGANEPREPLIPVTEWDKLGKAWTTQIQGSPGSGELVLGTGGHYPPYSAGPGTLGLGRPAGRKRHRQGSPEAAGTPLGAAARRDAERCLFPPTASVTSTVLVRAGVHTHGHPGEGGWRGCAGRGQRVTSVAEAALAVPAAGHSRPYP
ncbi:uncharacterized protein LOC110556549 [Meriones unguiculatus]|uniref:uncharacterized protein LOC110556549 n=1 Tax=Meriones unguiculatus TaxID=10047 RepID=UPI000B4F1DC9|nr:uncharacterized protein LOC110556549 [Meriones unguiculatus]XP_021506056.1 uncharacterized protein LOC110556549 [Meriones unguiculatus]